MNVNPPFVMTLTRAWDNNEAMYCVRPSCETVLAYQDQLQWSSDRLPAEYMESPHVICKRETDWQDRPIFKVGCYLRGTLPLRFNVNGALDLEDKGPFIKTAELAFPYINTNTGEVEEILIRACEWDKLKEFMLTAYYRLLEAQTRDAEKAKAWMQGSGPFHWSLPMPPSVQVR